MFVPASPHQDALIPCCGKSITFSGCKPFSEEGSKKFKNAKLIKKGEPIVEPTVDMILLKKLSFDKDLHPRSLSTKKIEDRDKLAGDYASVIQIAHLPMVRKDCRWGEDIGVHAPGSCERVTFEKLDHSYVYTYPFTLGFGNPFID